MDTISADDARYLRAKERVEELKGFYTHLAMYLAINGVLFLLNALTSDTWWFYWPLFGWGIGLAAHAISVFVETGRVTRDWEARKVRQLMERDDGTA
jgi:hypothetical protein